MLSDQNNWEPADDNDPWIRRLLLSSVPLRKLVAPGLEPLPESTATGCVVDYGGKRFLLTVEHGVARGNGWVIEIGYRQRQILFHIIEELRLLGKLTLDTMEMSLVDLALAQLPDDFESYSQHFNDDGKVVLEEPRHVLLPNFIDRASPSIVYGFSGYRPYQILPNHTAPRSQIFQLEQRVLGHLEFLGEEGAYYTFKFSNRHPGDDEIKGCSGAPILGKDGSFVALVCGGNECKGTLYALPLWRFKSFLDLEAGTVVIPQ